MLFRCRGLCAMSLDLFQMETELSTYLPTTVPRVFSLTHVKLYHLLIISHGKSCQNLHLLVFWDSQLRTDFSPSALYTTSRLPRKFQLNFGWYLRKIFKNNSRCPYTHRTWQTDLRTCITSRLWPSPVTGFWYLSAAALVCADHYIIIIIII